MSRTLVVSNTCAPLRLTALDASLFASQKREEA